MKYFKSLGLTAMRTRGSQADLDRASGSTVAPEDEARVMAFAKLKANWPRCPGKVTVNDHRTNTTKVITMPDVGFLWAFEDGTTKCTPKWDQRYYSMVVKGESPPFNMPKLKVGSFEYYKYLCRAQGNASIQKAFEKQGLRWKADRYDQHGHEHLALDPSMIMPCALSLKNTKKGNEAKWVYGAHHYAFEHANEKFSDKATFNEHRASECKNRVPPEQVAACEAFVSGGGGSIEKFQEKVANGDFNQGSQGGTSINQLYLYGGAVTAVVLLAAILKKDKR